MNKPIAKSGAASASAAVSASSAAANGVTGSGRGLQQAWLGWWGQRAPRERRLLTLGALALGLGLLWSVAVLPAWRTLATVPPQLGQLQGQMQQMQQLATEAATLRAAPALAPEPARAALAASVQRLGAQAVLAYQGERAVITFTAVDAPALSAWLAEARLGARARAVDARLARQGSGYSGTVVLELVPPLPAQAGAVGAAAGGALR